MPDKAQAEMPALVRLFVLLSADYIARMTEIIQTIMGG